MQLVREHHRLYAVRQAELGQHARDVRPDRRRLHDKLPGDLGGRSGQPRASGTPRTLQRSSREAQETFAKAHDIAVRIYGEGDQAYWAAYAALKDKFEKRGDHWIAKQPADPED